jgi:hypothetical protein
VGHPEDELGQRRRDRGAHRRERLVEGEPVREGVLDAQCRLGAVAPDEPLARKALVIAKASTLS